MNNQQELERLIAIDPEEMFAVFKQHCQSTNITALFVANSKRGIRLFTFNLNEFEFKFFLTFKTDHLSDGTYLLIQTVAGDCVVNIERPLGTVTTFVSLSDIDIRKHLSPEYSDFLNTINAKIIHVFGKTIQYIEGHE
jgi:hypothetical protein